MPEVIKAKLIPNGYWQLQRLGYSYDDTFFYALFIDDLPTYVICPTNASAEERKQKEVKWLLK